MPNGALANRGPDALDALLNNGLLVESNVPESARAALIQRGHKVTSNASPGGAFGGYQGIMFNAATRVLMGGSDVRKDGLAIGF